MARRRSGGWSEAHVRRLFWRAGFGATPKETRVWAKRGKAAAIDWLLNGHGARLVGPEPRIDGKPLDPVNEYGHDVLWWLDRMVRTKRPLVEKMTLFWHDHFATRDQDAPLMLAQNRMLRSHALGSFRTLVKEVTRDPAMLLFLSLADSDKEAPNENYARELMELFALGRGYSETDIREAARALTGFRADYPDGAPPRTSYDPERHDDGIKRIFGHRGRYDWKDVCDLVVEHPRHAPFLVEKLWDFFVATPIDRRKRKELARLYRRSRYRVKPLVGAILADRELYWHLGEPDMVKSPVVYVAGALRATRKRIDLDAWTWLLEGMGQTLFRPPSVAGWSWGEAWLSTNSARVRQNAVNYLLDDGGRASVPDKATPPDLKAKAALRRARRAVGEPWVSGHGEAVLAGVARRLLDGKDHEQDEQTRADHTQRVLRTLLLCGPDAQVH